MFVAFAVEPGFSPACAALKDGATSTDMSDVLHKRRRAELISPGNVGTAGRLEARSFGQADELGGRDQLNIVPFEFRKKFCEGLDGGGMRVADGQCDALLFNHPAK